MSTPFGAQSAWRQLVDLMGRRRIAVDPAIIARLRSIRADVPPPVRAASARALAFADPPFALVQLFADDELGIAAPVLRVARLRGDQWIEMLPGLSPAARSILRHRRDLGPDVRRALDSFGTVDFVLPGQDPVPVVQAEAGAQVAAEAIEFVPAADVAEVVVAGALPIAVEPEPLSVDWTAFVAEETELPPAAALAMLESVVDAEPVQAAQVEPRVIDTISIFAEPVVVPPTEAAEPLAEPEIPVEAPTELATAPASLLEVPEPIEQVETAAPTQTSPPEASFVSIASVALGLPVVAEALRLAGEQAAQAPVTASVVSLPIAAPPAVAAPVVTPEPTAPSSTRDPADGSFQISELVARIDAYHRHRDESPPPQFAEESQPALFDLEPRQAETFRFETDATGVVRWIEGAARAPLIGLSLDLAALPSGSRVDGAASGAFRRRAGFSNARLTVDGNSDAAGQWRITGIPVFDRANGRFTGYRGSARRPRADESAEPIRHRSNPAAESLRQLVHELRTPTNAIAGFAEMIEGELLGPVPRAYRDHAGVIRSQASGLLVAIDDIDLAARIETQALDLRPGEVPVAALLERIVADLAPLATLRSTHLAIGTIPEGLAICGDDRGVERLIARLSATLVAAGSAGETIGVSVRRDGDKALALAFDRPRALAAYAGEGLLAIDVESEAEVEGAPLLGTGFALRLARNFAVELGGSLTIADDRLTLRLPAVVTRDMEQVSTS